jgi:hypothetical protein
MVRTSMRSLGRLSRGIRLGLETGFDSGSTLDYVYRNVAEGNTPLGRMIDRSYLDSIGWRGIRVRKENLGRAIASAERRLGAAGQPVRIADIAAGHGRYVLEAVQALDRRPESILLRDYSDINVRDGTALIAEKNLQDIARFVKAKHSTRQALRESIRALRSGSCPGSMSSFPAMRRSVLRCAASAARSFRADTCFIPASRGHPQLELIARTLTSHRAGAAWVMRRRTQLEMDQLVRQAGFEKIDQWTDDWGIFTVSLAAKR